MGTEKINLSKRMRAVADLVTAGSRLADVGTDHAYVPIVLCREGKIPSAIAMDIAQGPLERAGAHIAACRLEDRIVPRLSDGLSGLSPGEADSVVIAGMGGLLTVRILKEAGEALSGIRELILQPQSDLREVRSYLLSGGWEICAERIVEEDGKFYPMMRAVPSGGTDISYTEWELCYGKMIDTADLGVRMRYLKREEQIRMEVLEMIGEECSGKAAARRIEILEELEMIREAMRCLRESEGGQAYGIYGR